MQATSSSGRTVELPEKNPGTRPRGAGLVVLAVLLIAVALASAVLVPLAQGRSVSWANVVGAYDGAIAAVIILLVIALVIALARWTLGPSEGRRERRRRRRRELGPTGDAPREVTSP